MSNLQRALVVVLALATVAVVAVGRPRSSAPAPASSQAWVAVEPPRSLRGWQVVDERGQPWSTAGFVGGWTVVLVGYTSCPDVCPTGLALLAEAMALDPSLGGVFLAVDPARDRARLGDYVRWFHPRLRGVTASSPALDQAVDAVGAAYRKSADGTFDHSTSFFVVDPGGFVVAAIPPPSSASALVARLAEVRAARGPALTAALWSPAAPPGSPRVAYGSLSNRSAAPLVVDGAATRGAELHATVTRDGVTGMQPRDRLTLAPGATVVLAPGGLHLMLPAASDGRVELHTTDGRRLAVAVALAGSSR